MNRPVILRPAARAEFDEAADWYEAKQAGLGQRFVAAVERVFDRIAANPQLHAVVRRDIRRAVVAGFPFCVYDRDLGHLVAVVSVFHTSRNPAVWQRRS